MLFTIKEAVASAWECVSEKKNYNQEAIIMKTQAEKLMSRIEDEIQRILKRCFDFKNNNVKNMDLLRKFHNILVGLRLMPDKEFIELPSMIGLMSLIKSLTQAEANFEGLMKAMKDPAYICSDYKVVSMNQAMIDRIGSDKTGQPCYKAINNLDSKCPFCVYNQVTKEGMEIQSEITSPLDGRFFRVSHIPVKCSNGGDCKIAVYRDETDRVDSERRLLESEQLYRSVFRKSGDAIIVTTREGIVEDINYAGSRLFGYECSEIIGQNAIMLWADPGKRSIWQAEIEANGSVYNYESEMETKDGKIILCLLTASVLVDSQDNIIRYTSIVRDITKARELEEKLRQAHRMEAIGVLASGIAHDFNNILTPIIGYSEITRDELPCGEHRDNMEEVIKASARARELVQQILAHSCKKHGGDLDLCNLRKIADEVARLIRLTMPTTVKIETDLDKPTGLISADNSQMHTLIMNLCVNAFQSMPNESGALHLSVDEVNLNQSEVPEDKKAGKFLRLEVADDGCGIEPAIINHIFDTHFTTKDEGSGSGLGLATVSKVVQNYNGFLRVNSEVGKGTTFQVYFPVMEVTTDDNLGEDESTEVLTGNERILLVDDEDGVLNVTKKVLESLGYCVEAFSESSQALTVFEKNPENFDIALTDQTMPGMTGEQLCKRLLEIQPDIPIIIWTGYKSALPDNHLDGIGARAILGKPLSKLKLSRALRKVLDKQC